MELSFGNRLKHAWNAFRNRDPTSDYRELGVGYSYRPDRPRLTGGNERSILTSVFNKIALDVASQRFEHCQLDADGRYLKTIDSGLNNCLTLEANIDQTARAFIQDIVISMFDEGAVAIAPIDTTINPKVTGSYDIKTMRVGKIVEWRPKHVKINVYNEETGRKEDVVVPKSIVAIIENPMYSVMNEPNSTMRRLIRKLNLLDAVDEQSSSGKLDLIIQLPYIVKSELKKREAEKRRKEIEMQLTGSKYGIAYADGTEKITQLNRPVENNLMKQIEYLTTMFYSQLGISKEVMEGTANEEAMLNYMRRTVEPITAAIIDGMKRVFLTKTARTKGQTIMCFIDPFKLMPVSKFAESVDALARNEIMSSNEARQIIGLKPSSDPNADKLRNSNMPQPAPEAADTEVPQYEEPIEQYYEGEYQNGEV